MGKTQRGGWRESKTQTQEHSIVFPASLCISAQCMAESDQECAEPHTKMRLSKVHLGVHETCRHIVLLWAMSL